jgi:ribosomal protein S12 methylthiotransferase accessory factor
MMGVREFTFGGEAADAANIMGIMVNGSGVYPPEFFAPQASYAFREWGEAGAGSNRELLRGLLDLLTAEGYRVYARDVSFLGFPGFHVIIPHFSEIETFDDTVSIGEYAEFNAARRLVRGLEGLGRGERERLIGFLRRLPYNPAANVFEFLNQPVADPARFPWYYGGIDLLLTVLLCQNGDLAGAAEVFARYAGFSGENFRHRGVATYYRCVGEYLAARGAGRSEAEAVAVLGLFFPEEAVAGAAAEFGDLTGLFANGDKPPCFDCGRCRYREHCLHPATERVYMLLKDRQAENPIDQKKLAELVKAFR